MSEDIEKWEEQDGVKFLRRIGLHVNQTVLDFGCRVGHYTIPAARIVGTDGIVYAIDKDPKALNELKRKASLEKLSNIEIVKTSDNPKLSLETGSIDIALLYDVLHYLNENERQGLHEEIFRVLKTGGILSVYPKHTAGDDPLMEFRNVHLTMLREEIQCSGFEFEHKYCGKVSHDDNIIDGCILNFRKSDQ